MKQKTPVPVTILTGYLGTGKTTLLNHILTQPHGYKCAIIINEFGAISIDNQLVIGADEEIVELNNGCLCCRLRGDLVRSLDDLFAKKKRFDYLLVETTGLADPSPIAHTFMMKQIAEYCRLDAIVTVVDARHLEKELEQGPEPAAQIAFADVVLLNKTDLVTPHDLNRLESRIRKMNSLTRIYRTQKAQIEMGKILNVKAREISAPLPAEALEDHDHHHAHNHDHDCEACGCNHDHGESGHPHSHHDESVKSFFIVEERPLDLTKTEKWLTDLLAEKGENVYRCKGVLHIKGEPKRVIFQGVQMMFEAEPDRFWNPAERRANQLVFIGKDLDEQAIREGFYKCLAG